MTLYADKMLASFPEGLKIPDALVAFFHWLDTQNLYRDFDGDGGSGGARALIDAARDNYLLYAAPVNMEDAKSWTQSDDPAVYNRLAPFFRLGGNGTHAALWRDDAGETQIVILGSGSTGVLTANAVDFLRLIAIGYEEYSFPDQYDLTPMEIYEEEYGDGDAEEYEEDYGEPKPAPPAPPHALRDWVCRTFDTTIPDRASDIVGEVADMDADTSTDPFWIWEHSLDKWK